MILLLQVLFKRNSRKLAISESLLSLSLVVTQKFESLLESSRSEMFLKTDVPVKLMACNFTKNELLHRHFARILLNSKCTIL